MAWKYALLTVALCGGCVGMVDGLDKVGDAGIADAAASPLAIAVLEPSAGSTESRDYLTGDGTWVARVMFRAEAEGAASVDWMAGGIVVGTGEPPGFDYEAEFASDGARTLDAVARGADGRELGRASVSFTVSAPPGATTCTNTLRSLGVDFTEGPAEKGVATPVTVKLPLNGIQYHSSSLSNAPRTSWFMDCELAVAMWKMGDVFRKAGITDAWDYGIYNYRCIDQTVSPPCPGSSLSMHAYAKAVDVAGVKTADGNTYSVNDDWVIDAVPSGKNACKVTPAATPENEFLHTLACELNREHVYDIILTPNFNSAHRNHFHMDLTDGSWLLHKVADEGVDIVGHGE